MPMVFIFFTDALFRHFVGGGYGLEAWRCRSGWMRVTHPLLQKRGSA